MLHWTWCKCFTWLVQFQFLKTNYFTLQSTTMTTILSSEWVMMVMIWGRGKNWNYKFFNN